VGLSGGTGAMPQLPGTFVFTPVPVPRDFSMWPQPVTTDAKGRFEVRGFGRGQAIDVLIQDDRFALQRLTLEVNPKDPKPISLSLAPAQWLEGRIVAEDTNKPLAKARITVNSANQRRFAVGDEVSATTGADGRFRVNCYRADTLGFDVFVPDGQPYLSIFKRFAWPKGAVKQSVEIALPRGILVRGKVMEKASGKAVAKVRVFFQPQRDNNPQGRKDLLNPGLTATETAPDGTFQTAVPAGPGHLLCTAPGNDFVLQKTSAGEISAGQPGGRPQYFHSIVPLNLKLQKEPKDVTITLRRGVTVRGRLVGPDGKPVLMAVLYGPGDLLPFPNPTRGDLLVNMGGPGLPRMRFITDGRFELSGCDPDRTYRIFLLNVHRDFAELGLGRRLAFTPDGFGSSDGGKPPIVDGKGRLGATVEIAAKRAADKLLTVSMVPCGAAEVRFVDVKGKPVQPTARLALVITPEQRPNKQVVAPETDRGVTQSGERITFPALIPGATYRLSVLGRRPDRTNSDHEFKAVSGKTIKLPDQVIREQK
jgi:hypothetical protein